MTICINIVAQDEAIQTLREVDASAHARDKGVPGNSAILARIAELDVDQDGEHLKPLILYEYAKHPTVLIAGLSAQFNIELRRGDVHIRF